MNGSMHPTPPSVDGFRNQQLDLTALPDHEDVVLEPVARGYVTYSLVLWGLLVSLPVVIGATVVALLTVELPLALAIIGAALVLAAAMTGYGYLDARVFGWAIREHDLITRAGVLWRSTTVVPLVRVQHVELSSGPLERAFGTARLQVFTAGSGGEDLVIYGLEPTQAERLRSHLRRRIDAELEQQVTGVPEVRDV